MRIVAFSKVSLLLSVYTQPKVNLFKNCSFYLSKMISMLSKSKMNLLICCSRTDLKSRLNSQAGKSPELAIRGVFRLSRLGLSSYSKTVKKYTQQIEYLGFFEIIDFYARRLWDPQNAFENFRQ